ncbi:MAG TPA: ATP-binding protein [Lacibacter sp.]|nr:ATP-binding protein [Lacibacter sp.]HMO90150.1 ATP-binding protein [Lacibacter sp.]HMP85841.1 ATP-binding protein [Lacibacter sp.]
MGLFFRTGQMHRLFPFHLLMSEGLVIRSAGQSLEKLTGSVAGCRFAELFELYRPADEVSSFSSLAGLAGQLAIVRFTKKEGILLRGQFEVLDDTQVVFLGSPWYSGMDEVTAAGLTLNDFAPHDPLVDLLHLLHTQEIATRDIRDLYEKMAEQSRLLQEAVKEKEQIASLPMQDPDPVLRIDLEGAILMQNPAADGLPSRIVYNGKQLTPAVFLNAVAAETSAAKGRLVVEAAAGDRLFSFNCFHLPGENYINIYSRDVTDLKQLALHLEGTANRLGALIGNLQAGVLLENENCTIELVNQRFCDMFGIPASPAQLTGTDCSEAAGQSKHLFKDPDAFTERIRHLLLQREVAKADLLELQDGRVFSRDFIPIYNGQQYMGHLWVYDDITVEANAKEALHAQRSFYEDILNNLPADIAVFNKRQEYLFLNPRAVKNPAVRGWLIGKTDEDYRLHTGKEPAVFLNRRQLFQQLLQDKMPQRFEEELRLPDGNLEHHLRIFFPVLNSHQNIEMVIGYGIDITERKKMEQQLQEALRQTAEEASVKERFFATMSHEIRTPLNGILGVTELLLKTALQAEQQAYTEMIRSAGNQLLRIVNDVLDFEKIINGSIEPESIRFDLVELIRQAAAPFALLAAEKNVRFTYDAPAEVVPVAGDAFRIRQILNNLLSNAVKFTAEGGIRIQLNILERNGGNCEFSIVVSDSGTGIEQHSLNAIFEPYTQAGSAISRKYGGTGLGLAISRHLAQLMGGSLHVASKPGEGSDFTLHLTLPLAGLSEQAESTAPDVLPVEVRKSLRILAAEDNPINQFLLQHLLGQWDCSFQLAETGKQVLEAMEQSPFDIILMDIEMPVMDGIDTAKAIRKSGKSWSSVPIIAITANAMKESRELYKAAGMNGYVTKPYNEQELQKAIATVLETGSQRGSLLPDENTSLQPEHLRYFSGMSDDPAFLEQMKILLRQNIPVLLNRLQEAQQYADTDAIARALHQLKPLARMLALYETEALIVAAETRIRSRKDLRLPDSILRQLSGRFEQIMEGIR